MAAAGSAVGLGNIWRFPYVTGENGGAAFVVVYLACVFLIGVPLMWCELALGRASGEIRLGHFQKPVAVCRFFSPAYCVWPHAFLFLPIMV